MTISDAQESALSDLRVLDLTNHLGAYCTKLLADVGADVLKVEPPGGSALRRRGPFYHNEPHIERNLEWLFLSTNHRSITLDLDSNDGQEIFKKLVVEASVLVEDTTPGIMQGRGLAYEHLRTLRPDLIYTSITPYGQNGPYAKYLATDLTLQAMGGAIQRVGWRDEPPNSTVGGQTANQIGSQAAAATLAALYFRDVTGTGQHVDLSAQAGMAVVDFDALPRYASGGGIVPRGAMPGEVEAAGESGFHARRIWPGKAGKTRMMLIHVVSPPKEWSRFVDWLESHDMAADLGEPAWMDFDYRIAHIHHIEEVTEAFLATLPAQQAMEEGQARGIRIVAFGRIHELVQDPQLAEEGFFISVEHPDLHDTLTYPGGPYRFSETPWRIRRSAPRLGEHNVDIYQGELGLSGDELVRLRQAGVI